ncbi:LysR family transcriptional regulator [Actinokineospora bangkokensis]|uniref:HTH lysR-type domain-containing protein n=1 Tax=Actinokineospora bangkokensis TaxID=1193682 RepID=A0A1Q9LL86_9PSEU|nr:LysR family transcriptional regulator [Actinokineospora bangkokensis]OLR92796.1 hypothetical protein BJP25_19395 [Actinokineospora bangkokensis]
MELRSLEYFVAVAEVGSFTGAAARLHLVQSTLSVAVRGLEHELGVPLFERSTRRVELTAAGRELLGPARAALRAAEAVRDTAAGLADGTSGTLRIGIMHSLPGFDLAGLITAFHRERPLVRLAPVTHPDGSTGLAGAVADHRLDLAFAAVGGARGGQHPDLDVVDLASEPIQLLCPPGHPLAGRSRVRLAELAGERFIDVPAAWGSRMSVDRHCAAHGLHREVAVEVGDVATVVELVRAGLGVALLAPTSAPRSVRAELITVAPHPVFTVSMLTARDRPLPATARRFIALAHQHLAPR